MACKGSGSIMGLRPGDPALVWFAPGERPTGLQIRPPGGITAGGTMPLADQ
jgi:hypothetical protein